MLGLPLARRALPRPRARGRSRRLAALSCIHCAAHRPMSLDPPLPAAPLAPPVRAQAKRAACACATAAALSRAALSLS